MWFAVVIGVGLLGFTIITATRNAVCDAVVDQIDIGSADAQGDIEIWTSGFGTKLAELQFSNPAFGTAATGVATANSITSDTSADATGTAAVGRLRNRDNDTLVDFAVSTSGSDLNFNTLSFVAGGTVAISSMSLTVPAS